jgi:hypothetical protein
MKFAIAARDTSETELDERIACSHSPDADESM